MRKPDNIYKEKEASGAMRRFHFLVVFSIIFFILFLGYARAEQVVFDSSFNPSTWTVPANVYSISVELWGGGGGGGPGAAKYYVEPGIRDFFTSGGGGGGGGGYGLQTINVLPGTTYTIVVGSGGNGGSVGASKGLNGGTTTFSGNGVALNATGGGGGGEGSYQIGGAFAGNGGTSNAVQRSIPGGWAGIGGYGFWSAGRPDGCGIGGIGGNYTSIRGGDGSMNSGGGGGVSGGGAIFANGVLTFLVGSRVGDGGNGLDCTISNVPTPANQGKAPGGGGGGGMHRSSQFGVPTTTGGAAGANGLVIINYTIAQSVSQSGTNMCSAENQTILSLYSQNNSHTAVFNVTNKDVNAQYSICYDKIFGSNYTGSNNPWTCTGSNSIVKLSSVSNAHAEDATLSHYPITVCYGVLSCTLKSTCSAGEQAILTLSSQTNAHLAVASYSYPQKVCCLAQGFRVLGFNGASWRDRTTALSVSSASRYSSVVLYAETNFTPGTAVTFEIWEKDASVDDPIRTGNANLTGVVDVQGIARANWTITDSDIAAGVGQGFFDEDYGSSDQYLEFYFNASVSGKAIGSGILTTSKTAGVIAGSGCEVSIASPVHKGIYFANTSVIFAHTALPSGSSVRWSIAEDAIIRNEDTFTYLLATSGQKTITLQATIPGCVSVEAQIALLVISMNADLSVFIDKPKQDESIPLANLSSVSVPFSAQDTYIINSSYNASCSGTITCLAGTCPGQTANAPPGCSNNVSVSNANPSPGFAAINFTWSTFNQGTELPAFLSGLGEVQGSRTFSRSEHSSILFDKAFKVVATYTSGSMNLQGSFTRNFTLGECINRGYNFTVINNQGGIVAIQGTTNYSSSIQNYNSNACKGRDGNAGTSDECCPANYVCSETSGCVPKPDNAPIRCENYGTKSECERDAYGLWQYQQSSQENSCSAGIVVASCAWKDAQCVLNTTIQTSAGVSMGSCYEHATNISSCVNGYYRVHVDASPEGSLACFSCTPGEYPIPCGRPAFELPFFGSVQFIAALGILALFYFFATRRSSAS